MLQLALLPMTEARSRELVGWFGLKAKPLLARRYCAGKCCKGKTPRGHGPYWFINHRYVGKDAALTRLAPELAEARRYFVANIGERVGAQKDARRVSKTRRAGGTRCGHTEQRTG
jgi:hypothetical protein